MPAVSFKCTMCGKGLPLPGGIYYTCSVSTCNKKRLPMRFCSWDCWDAHLPDARHRNASCIEERPGR